MAETSRRHQVSLRPPPVRWRVWPMRAHLGRTLLVSVGLLAVSLLTRWLTGQVYLAVLVLLAMVATLWRFFVPVDYELSNEGVDQWVLGRRRLIPWHAVRCYELGPDGVLLLPVQRRSMMDPLRGLYVPYGEHRDEVVAHLRHYLGDDDPSQLTTVLR